jgi:hypothetical protein
MKKSTSKKSTIYTSYEGDMAMVIKWLKLKKVLTDLGEIVKSGTGYSCRVKSKKTKKELSDILKGRFGLFVKVI